MINNSNNKEEENKKNLENGKNLIVWIGKVIEMIIWAVTELAIYRKPNRGITNNN